MSPITLNKHGRLPSTRRSGGFALAEVLLASLIAVGLFAAVAVTLQEQRQERTIAERAAWMAQYVNAVSAYMAAQGAVAPAVTVRDGTDWLKSTNCGGIMPVDGYFLSCNVPTNFNGVYSLGATTLGEPRVRFDWTTTPTAPTAEIDFGIVQTGGQPNPKIAASLAAEINRKLEVDGYEFATVFAVDFSDLDVTVPANVETEIMGANLRAEIDASIESTTFVRRDGNTVMTGPLVSEHDNWAMVAKDSDGNENADPQNPIASANLNDLYIRASDTWLSETHELAEEAYRLAIRAPLLVANVRSGTTVRKPECPAPLSAEIIPAPAAFLGGTASETKLLAGTRIAVTENGSVSWTLRMETSYDGSSGFQALPNNSDLGLIQVTVKCS